MNVDSRRARFETLAPEVIDAVRRYLARRTDPATADDVLSETLLICWRRLDEIPEEHLPWAYGVARNCLSNAERGHRRQFRLLSRISRLDPPPQVAAGASGHLVRASGEWCADAPDHRPRPSGTSVPLPMGGPGT